MNIAVRHKRARIRKSVALKIQVLRKSEGWTRLDLAQRLLTSSALVARWETRAACPSAVYLVLLAEVFKVTVDSLIMVD